MSDDNRVIDRVTGAMDDSTARIDAATMSRLNRARQRAVEQSSPLRYSASWLAAGTVTAMVAIVFSAWLTVSVPTAPRIDPERAEFLAVTDELSAEEIELIYDLEFYTWLSEQQDAG